MRKPEENNYNLLQLIQQVNVSMLNGLSGGQLLTKQQTLLADYWLGGRMAQEQLGFGFPARLFVFSSPQFSNI